MKNIALKTLGGISLLLGVLGVFLPLLPSTCFILLSAWAFNKSSPRFHNWLVNASPFANSIQNWQNNKSVPRKVKWIASVSLMSSFGITAWLVPNPIVLTALAVGMLSLLAYLLTRPDEFSNDIEVTSEYIPESNQLVS